MEDSYRSQIAEASVTERWGLGDVGGGVVLAQALVIFVGGLIYAAAGWEPGEPLPVWGFGVLQVPLWSGYVAMTVVAGRKGSGLRRAFGLDFRSTDPIIGLATGIAFQMLVLPIIYVPILRLTGTNSDELSAPAKRLAGGAQSGASWLLFAVLVALVAPVVEELFFRGLLLRSLSKFGMEPATAVLVSSVIFAGIHFQILQFFGLFVFALALAGLTIRSGRLGPAVFAHIGFNGTSVVVLFLDYRSRLR